MKLFLYKKFEGYRIFNFADFFEISLKIKIFKRFERVYKRRFQNLSFSQKKFIIEHQFQNKLGYKLNLNNPKTLNEKLQWIKLYYKNPLMTICADKYLMKEYISKKIEGGGGYTIPLLGVWDRPCDIDFDALPNQFVLKVNWGSGQNIIVQDKTQINIDEIKEKLERWIQPHSNHYFGSFEWAYKDIKPKIIAEKYIKENGKPINDYKISCYNGIPKKMQVAINGFDYSKLKINYYDMNFKRLDIKKYYPNFDEDIKKPVHFDKMVEISKILSKDFPFVRVDFYDTGESLYVGELTFYPGNGMSKFKDKEWDLKLGSMLDLKGLKRNI